MDSGEQATESFSMPEELIAEESLQAEDVPSWLKGMDEGKVEEFAAEEDTTSWLKSLDEEEGPVTPSESETMPAWMQDSSEEKVGSVETAVPSAEAEISDWLTEVEEPTAEAEIPSQGKAYSEELPGWLSDLDKEEEEASKVSNTADLPQWMRDETGEVVAEPTKIEPTRSTDWHPVTEEKVDETPLTEPEPAPEPKPEPKKKSAPRKPSVQSAQVAEPVAGGKIFGATALAQTSADGGLELARTELSRSNIPGALDGYSKLIKKGRFLDEVIYDLRDALYRYPVEVSIWQTLGDAYMRANRLQDALDAYTKAEELLR
jgi:hypothetical protein